MVFVPVTILGGLPVIAEVWFSGPDYYGEYDSGCDGLYWQRRDGSKGAPLSERVMERVEKEGYWDAYVTEQANDWLGCHCPIRYSDGREEGDWSPEFIALNGDPRAASVDTHAKRGDEGHTSSPSPMGSAVPPTAGDAQPEVSAHE